MNPFRQPRSVVVLDNVSMHCNPRIKEIIEAAGCVVEYLPPYSPDYSLIELTFSVSKAWLRRYLKVLRRIFQGNFGWLLQHAIKQSRCDQYTVEHFKYAAGGFYLSKTTKPYAMTWSSGVGTMSEAIYIVSLLMNKSTCHRIFRALRNRTFASLRNPKFIMIRPGLNT